MHTIQNREDNNLNILETSVLFLVFNRLDTTQQVFEAIKKAKPPRLYIASDGPRESKPDEDKKVQEVRDYILSSIDWDCVVKTLFRDTNLGCRYAIQGAINWFFENEEMGIILEDDCLPSQSFFGYCENLLKIYENDTRIMCVSGNNFFSKIFDNKYSYHFSEIPLIWGWATWKRAWLLDNKALNNFSEIQALKLKLTSDTKADKMWWKRIGKTYNKQIDTWDYLWTFTNLINNGLTIIPKRNLVKNIGIAHINSTHTRTNNKNFVKETFEISFPIIHPPFIKPNFRHDTLLYKNYFNVNSYWRRIILEIKRQINI